VSRTPVLPNRKLVAKRLQFEYRTGINNWKHEVNLYSINNDGLLQKKH